MADKKNELCVYCFILYYLLFPFKISNNRQFYELRFYRYAIKQQVWSKDPTITQLKALQIYNRECGLILIIKEFEARFKYPIWVQ